MIDLPHVCQCQNLSFAVFVPKIVSGICLKDVEVMAMPKSFEECFYKIFILVWNSRGLVTITVSSGSLLLMFVSLFADCG